MQFKSVIVAAKRTPIGSFQGQLSSLTASDLASHLIINIMRDLDIPADAVEKLLLEMSCLRARDNLLLGRQQ